MLRFLADGLRSTQDWRVFKRRRTWDLLASMFQSSRDRALRKGILEVGFPSCLVPSWFHNLVVGPCSAYSNPTSSDIADSSFGPFGLD